MPFVQGFHIWMWSLGGSQQTFSSVLGDFWHSDKRTNNQLILVQACSWPVRRQSFAKKKHNSLNSWTGTRGFIPGNEWEREFLLELTEGGLSFCKVLSERNSDLWQHMAFFSFIIISLNTKIQSLEAAKNRGRRQLYYGNDVTITMYSTEYLSRFKIANSTK